jgi:cell division protein FtsB
VPERARPPARKQPAGAARNPKPKPKPKQKQKQAAPRRSGGAVRLAAASVVLVGLLFAFVYPTRTFLDQRAETNKARSQLQVLQSENARLARESKRLSTDSEIERLAREKYGLVKPGERPFVILPAPTTSTAPPAAATTPTTTPAAP